MPGTSVSKTSFRQEHWSAGSPTNSKTTFLLEKTFSSLGVPDLGKLRCSMPSASSSRPMSVSSSSKTPLKFTWPRTTWSVSRRDSRRTVCLPSLSGISSKPPSVTGPTGSSWVKYVEERPGRRFVSEVVEIHGYDPDRDEYNYGFIFDSHKEPL